MKCQGLFSGKNKKKIIHLLSTKFAQRLLKVKIILMEFAIPVYSCG